MPNASRQKGDRFERDCVHKLVEEGIPAQRVPLSGAAGGMFSSDLMVEVCGRLEKIECKTRKRAWTDLFGWLPGNFALFIKADRTDTLVVMDLATFARLAKGIL
jgi:hypothetical protein